MNRNTLFFLQRVASAAASALVYAAFDKIQSQQYNKRKGYTSGYKKYKNSDSYKEDKVKNFNRKQYYNKPNNYYEANPHRSFQEQYKK